MANRLEEIEWRQKQIKERVQEVIRTRGKRSFALRGLRDKLLALKQPSEQLSMSAFDEVDRYDPQSMKSVISEINNRN